MSTPSAAPGPILTAHLFAPLEAKLIELLRSLAPGDWERPTVSPRWKVKDVTAHLLDTQLRKLSLARDGCMPSGDPPADLVALINRLNEEGVAYFRRLSPAVLISLMEMASQESVRYHQSLDPFAPALFAVSWAGEKQSLNWFDTAREFTERWHHQQQIRLAVGQDKPGIMTREFYYPVLDCFLRALPHTYREVAAAPGTLLRITVAGDCGGDWYLRREDSGWKLVAPADATPAAAIAIPQEIAWRIFTKGIGRASAEAQVSLSGDSSLALPVLSTMAIVG